MKTIIETKDLRKVYKRGSLLNRISIEALDGINLSVESDKPAIVSLVGESGCGKTTFAKVLLRLVKPTSGSAKIYDRVVAGEGSKPTKQEFLTTVQPIFQEPTEAFSSYKPVDSYLRRTAMLVNRLGREATVEVMREALSSVGLKYEDVRGKYPNQFSGGELQRVSIARALIPNPKMIIGDEPVSMIDASLRMNIINLFLELKEQYETSFLFVTHDLSNAYYISDYIAAMYRGCIVEFGDAKAVLTDPQHPYTKLLLESLPLTNRKWDEEQIAMSGIETEEYQFEGCKFWNRCPIAEDICNHQRPDAVRKEDGRDVYCHFA